LEFIPPPEDHVFMTTSNSSSIVLRRAVATDLPALDRLAQLDSQRLPSGSHLVAERDGEIVAALAQPSNIAIADPFAPTADAVALLREWAAQRTARPPRRARRPRVAVVT
jgi:hypothetical protein